MNREAFLNQINQEGFSFSIDITSQGFQDFKSVVRRRKLSEEQLYQMFVEYFEELENCLEEAGDYRRMMFDKYPVSPVHDKYKTRFDAVSPNGREFRFEFVFTNDNHLKEYHIYETVNGRKKITLMDLISKILDAL